MTDAVALAPLASLAPLVQRLRAAGDVLLVEVPAVEDDPPAAASLLLEVLVEAVHAEPSPDRVWLLLVAVTGRYPMAAILDEARYVFELETPGECARWLLGATLVAEGGAEAVLRPMRVVTGSVLVNVDHTAKHDLHTGVQRVIRQTVPRWVEDHGAVPVAWFDDRSGFRHLSGAERQRVLRWGSDGAGEDDDHEEVLLVPWRCVVVVIDVDLLPALERLVPLASRSGNACVGVGYDCIPVVSAGLIPWGGAGQFARFLELVKSMRRIAGISRSAAAEFRGWVDTLPAQGLVGPRVLECALPYAPVPVPSRAVADPACPLVVAVGSYEPRKNQAGLLHAAEVLWREGLRFRLQLVGGMSWDTEVADRISELQAAGRPLEAHHRVSEQLLADAYVSARVSVFASLHEGYGLPIVESLAAGTPVITSCYGSTAELAVDGGVVLIDPRDDASLVDALRELLTDDARIAGLRDEITRRPFGSWRDYAAELWSTLVAPELAELGELAGHGGAALQPAAAGAA